MLELSLGGAQPMKIVALSCDPPEPKAGQPFKLTVEMNEHTNIDVLITMEKQRVVRSFGGQPEVRPTGGKYFSIDPPPIEIKTATKAGTSDFIEVRIDAKGLDGDPPVAFPEQLLFTAYSPASSPISSTGFLSALVRIL